MAAVIKCECCGNITDCRTARHVRFYEMTDAMHYNTNAVLYCDVCDECQKKMTAMLNHKEANK